MNGKSYDESWLVEGMSWVCFCFLQLGWGKEFFHYFVVKWCGWIQIHLVSLILFLLTYFNELFHFILLIQAYAQEYIISLSLW